MAAHRSAALAGLLASLAAIGGRGSGEELPPGVAARLGPHALTFERFHAYLAGRFEGTEEGEAAQRQATRCRIVEAEARARGIAVPAEAIRARRAELDAQLRAAGQEGVEANLRTNGIGSAEFDGLLRLALLHEAVVRSETGIGEKEPVSQEALEKWLEERLAKAPPAGSPSSEEFGRSLRHLLGPARVRELLLEALTWQLVEERARATGISPRPQDFDAEIERRRSRVAEDPKYMGASLEDILRATGRSVEALRRDPRTRTAVLLDLLVERTFPPERLAEQFERERARLDAAHGEGRRASILFLRAAASPTPQVPRTFEGAEAELRALAGRCADLAAFAEAARTRSEDEASKTSGGDLGVLHRGDAHLDPMLLEAAFRAAVGKTEGPVRLKDGAALLFVREKVAPAGEAALLERLRAELRTRIYREIVPPGSPATYLD
ncbi:MAG: peptidyl-prolyl cis-trans isomerase [Planctomycetes bacterium]|nr:peptidyl-prolyl cis-trans isomerase [Planctomycetota bacterium]